mmetsp:Transcript_102481/g.198429  ORF Transcript_102481/g.198429 Transcript_102481/m.198429 type:complete len:85 (-) Transcript_102481:835-1089(-)
MMKKVSRNIYPMKHWRVFLQTLWPLPGNKPVVVLAQEKEEKVKARDLRAKREKARARAKTGKNNQVMPTIETTALTSGTRKVLL